MNRKNKRPDNVGPPQDPPAGHEELLDRIKTLPRQRTYLLPALIDVQHELGWIPDWAIEFIGAHLRVPKSEAYGAASSYPELRLTELPEHVLHICQGASCRMAGSTKLAEQMVGFAGEVRAAECLFICPMAPAAQLDGRFIGRATVERLRV